MPYALTFDGTDPVDLAAIDTRGDDEIDESAGEEIKEFFTGEDHRNADACEGPGFLGAGCSCSSAGPGSRAGANVSGLACALGVALALRRRRRRDRASRSAP